MRTWSNRCASFLLKLPHCAWRWPGSAELSPRLEGALNSCRCDGRRELRCRCRVLDHLFQVQLFARGPFLQAGRTVTGIKLAAAEYRGVDSFVDGLHPSRI